MVDNLHTLSVSALDSAQELESRSALLWHSRPLEAWHLLSLDAPTVAVVWTWFIARCFGVLLPWNVLAAMGLVVWIIYVLDRLLDARRSREPLQPRHFFHHRHRRGFTRGACCALALTLPLIATLSRPALRLDVGLGASLLLWCGVIHRWFRSRAASLPKEFVVGLFFACATMIPTLARLAAPPPALILAAILLGALCTINCLYISAWESGNSATPANFAIALAAASVLAAVVEPRHWQVFGATGLAAALLTLLSHLRQRLGATSLRAAADLVLLTPLLLVPFLK